MQLITTDQIATRFRTLSELPVTKQLGLMVGLALSVAIGISVVLWSREPLYRPLYSNLSPTDASEIVGALQERGVAYRVDEHSGTIQVPAEEMHETRLALAAAGMPKGGGVGFELLDRQGSFGESELMESARYQRVLEGELGRTIASLADVQGVRVHLALPKRSLFVRDRVKPSASVLLNLFPGRTLGPAQVQAIVHLVSSGIPSLERERVTVIDQSGRLLSNAEESGGLEGSMAQLDFARRIESEYARRVEGILTPVIGAGRVRAQVTAELDFTVTEATEERYDPASQALRSEQTSEQQARGTSITGGIPGALSNQPPPGGSLEANGQLGGGGSERSSRNATRNYEVDRTIRHVRTPSGALERLSVAVVIDDRVATDEEGNPVGEPLSREELEDLTVLVKQAVGFDEARGDSVHVVNASFQAGGDGLALAEPPLWEQPWFWGLLKQGAAAVVVLLLAFIVLRPLMRGLSQNGQAGQGTDDGSEEHAVGAKGGDPALTAPEELRPDQVALSHEAQHAAGGLPPPVDDYQGRVSRAQAIVGEDPRGAAELVKEWLASDQ